MDESQYTMLKARIRQLTRIDLDCYRDTQMRRRLSNYIEARRQGVESFCQLLGTSRQEARELKDFLTINVSEFFRDSDHFEVLRKQIIPRLLDGGRSLNVWSAGCSMGAEPHTVSMLLAETAPLATHRVLGTDIDERMLEVARAGGPYSASDIKAVPRPFVSKYFTEGPGGYYLRDRVRKRVEFRRHDLLADPYEREFDLILCRNVVIYFTEAAKRQLARGFATSLRPGGVLFIGATEALLPSPSLGLERLSTCFYQRVGGGPETSTG